jgi:lantibiotic biosynthesis protein
MPKPTTPEPPLYRALDFAMVRTPLLPVEAYLSLKSDEDQFALLKDPRVRRAVAVGSVSLLHALDRFEQSALTKKDAERLRAKLLRYQIRMSTRPTPYGLFAGCAVVPLGNHTDLSIRSSFGRCHTRPDMAWLMEMVAAAESDLEIRKRLRLIRNPLIRFEGDRIWLADRMPAGDGGRGQPVSARLTSVVKLVLDLAKHPVEYSSVVSQIAEASGSATPEKIDRLLTGLWEQTFLLTDLRPPLTTESPVRYVLERLTGIPEAAAMVKKLESFLEAAALWDGLPHEESLSAFRALLKQTDSPEDGSKEAPFQVDLALCAEGALATAVAEEGARAAELLLRLSPSPRGLSSLAAYRNAFISRYGHEREVPLLELLDADRGLGSVAAHGHAFVGPDQSKATKRSQALLALACSALHNRQRVLILDESTMGQLETWEPQPESAPVSLDINLLVAARSAEAIDAGEFTVVVGPNLGAWAAGRNFGRFAHLHSAEQGREALCRAACAEQTNHLRDHLWAEVVYLPSKVRSANVVVRPAVRSYEAVFGVSPGVSEAAVIPLDELVVGVENNRFYVRWPAAGKRLRFVSGHMLNDRGAPPVAQFLMQAGYDGIVPFMSFEWGPAEGFPFLPRVQAGRVVLRPAEWKISRATMGADGWFEKWRQEWEVPRHVCLSFGDNRLIFDLNQNSHVQQITAELTKLPEGQSLLIQEVLPSFDETWLSGEEGHYYSEFVIPLVLRPSAAPATDAREAEASRVEAEAPAISRQCPPGSDWLFVKLYCPAHRGDDLIGDSFLPFADNVVAAGLADSWFFIRYADPEDHLRLRFHGTPERLSSQLFGQVCQWAADLMERGLCTRFVFDTYDREIERFGGAEGMAISESLFHADSCAAAELVRVLKSKQWTNDDDRTALFALTLDDLLSTAGLDGAKRLDWYKSQTATASRDSGAEFRKVKNTLRAALGDPSRWLAEKPLGDVIEAALTRRRQKVVEFCQRLRDLDRPVEKLCASYTHLHLNRIGAATAERRLIGLLLRTRESLAKAPLSRTPV